eukprot:g1856.t1
MSASKRQKTETEAHEKSSEENECLYLFDWVRACGGLVSDGIEMRSCPAGRGVFAARDMAEGELLLSLPPEIVLTTQVALETPVGRILASACRIVKVSVEEGIGYGVGVEAAVGSADDTDAAASSGARNCDVNDNLDDKEDDQRPVLTERSVLYAFLIEARNAKPERPTTGAGAAAGQAAADGASVRRNDQDANFLRVGAMHAYAHALPSQFTTPFSWGPRELAFLPGGDGQEFDDDQDRGGVDLLSELASIGQHLQAQFNIVKSVLSRAQRANVGLVHSEHAHVHIPTIAEWLWAHQAFASRCLPSSICHPTSIARGSPCDTEDKLKLRADADATANATALTAAGTHTDADTEADGVLVPVLDLFNAVEDAPHVRWNTGDTTARLGRAVGAGQEIFSTYGRKGNGSLLACYGYCRWGNSADRVPVWISALRCLSREPSAARANARTLRAFQAHAGAEVAGLRFELTRADPLPLAMLEAARVCCDGNERRATAYLHELVDEGIALILGGDSAEELDAMATAWRAKQDGSSMHVVENLGTDVGGGTASSYACSAEACAIAFRQSQLAVLRAASEALVARANTLKLT